MKHFEKLINNGIITKKDIENFFIDRKSVTPRKMFDIHNFTKAENIERKNDYIYKNNEIIAKIEKRYSKRKINLEYKELKGKIKWY